MLPLCPTSVVASQLGPQAGEPTIQYVLRTSGEVSLNLPQLLLIRKKQLSFSPKVVKFHLQPSNITFHSLDTDTPSIMSKHSSAKIILLGDRWTQTKRDPPQLWLIQRPTFTEPEKRQIILQVIHHKHSCLFKLSFSGALSSKLYAQKSYQRSHSMLSEKSKAELGERTLLHQENLGTCPDICLQSSSPYPSQVSECLLAVPRFHSKHFFLLFYTDECVIKTHQFYTIKHSHNNFTPENFLSVLLPSPPNLSTEEMTSRM